MQHDPPAHTRADEHDGAVPTTVSMSRTVSEIQRDSVPSVPKSPSERPMPRYSSTRMAWPLRFAKISSAFAFACRQRE